jgi:aconitate hydratase
MEENTPLIVMAGKEYGTGSSRDWAAKGTSMLGIKAVIAVSYERIHRNNLVGMGALPLVFKKGEGINSFGLDGTEIYSIKGLEEMEPGKTLQVTALKTDGSTVEFEVISRLDTAIDVTYFRHGGILPYVLRQMLKEE